MKRGLLWSVVLVSILHVLLYPTCVSAAFVYQKIEYQDVPSTIRALANSEVNKGTYCSSTYAVPEKFDVTVDCDTIQSQIRIDDLHSNIWNIVYFGKDTSAFMGAVLLDCTGEILLSYVGNESGFAKKIEEIVGKPFYDWSVEEQHTYDELFLQNPHREWHYSLPKTVDLPLDDLICIAKEYLANVYHVPQTELSSYRVQHSYITGLVYPGDGGRDEGKCILRFVNPNYIDPYKYQVTLSAVNGTIYFSTPFPNEQP